MTSRKPKQPFCSFEMLLAHTSCTAAHSHKAWMANSDSLVQIGHLSSLMILLLTRLNHVGKISLHALHQKTLISFGIQSFHKTGQIIFPAHPLEDSARFPLPWILLANLYADLIENFPFLLYIQMIEFEIALQLRGILQIASTSSLWNNDTIISLLHTCNSGLIYKLKSHITTHVLTKG